MKQQNNWRLAWLGAVAAFCTYACMYAFRKGITAATFDGMAFWGINYKIWLLTAQVFGYAVSKMLGIKVVSEMKPARRAFNLLIFVGIAEVALLAFAVVPAPYNIIFLFLNGLPLGMVYGTVLGFLEGRRETGSVARRPNQLTRHKKDRLFKHLVAGGTLRLNSEGDGVRPGTQALRHLGAHC